MEGQLKLIDFGIAKAIGGDTTSIARESQVCGFVWGLGERRGSWGARGEGHRRRHDLDRARVAGAHRVFVCFTVCVCWPLGLSHEAHLGREQRAHALTP